MGKKTSIQLPTPSNRLIQGWPLAGVYAFSHGSISEEAVHEPWVRSILKTETKDSVKSFLLYRSILNISIGSRWFCTFEYCIISRGQISNKQTKNPFLRGEAVLSTKTGVPPVQAPSALDPEKQLQDRVVAFNRKY